MTIALIGVLLSVQSSGGPHSYTLHQFKLAFCVQYLFWVIGLLGLLHSRRRLRRARAVALDPFPRAVVRYWRGQTKAE